MLKPIDTDKAGTIRIREGVGVTVIYTKLAENRWSIAYISDGEFIEGHCSDPIAMRWPVIWKPQ